MIDSLMIIFLLQIVKFHQCEVINNPTVKPTMMFLAESDGEVIRDEMKKGLLANRELIARIWYHRTYDERKQIEGYYDKKFCPDEPEYRCPLHGAFSAISTMALESLYHLSLMSMERILAETIHESIVSGNGEVGAIEEVVCANDKHTKDSINKYYQANYQTTVEDHLATFRKDDHGYQQIMQNYCWKGLCQEQKITTKDVDNEVKALRDIDPRKDKEGFKNKLIEMLDKHCEPDLKLIFQKYRIMKNGINDGVDEAFEIEREKRAYNVLVRYIENSSRFYADQLHHTCAGSPYAVIRFNEINRIVVTRCEKDLLSILQEYHDKHHKTFTNRLKISGDKCTTGISVLGMHSISLWQTVKTLLTFLIKKDMITVI